MTTKAIYEKGALHPLEPLSLAEGAQVEVIVRIPEVAAPEGVDAGARLAGDEGGAGARGGSAERRSACRARSRPLSLRSSSAAMTFADAGAWGAVAMEADENHDAASRWYYANRDRLFTTDYVVDETLTLWRAREAHRQALIYGAKFFSGHLAVVHRLTEAEYEAAWEVFGRYDDKEWSFTDCTSKVVMEARGIRHAFTFDSHFRQFGSVIVVP